MAKKTMVTERLILRPHADHRTHVIDLDDGVAIVIRLDKINNKISDFKGFTGEPVQLTIRLAPADKKAPVKKPSQKTGNA